MILSLGALANGVCVLRGLFVALPILVVALPLWAGPALGQSPIAPHAPEPGRPAQSDSTATAPEPTTPSARLERYFQRLAAAKDETEGKAIAEQIERVFDRSGSDTADLLMERAKKAITGKDYETALDLLDFVLTLQPDWAEAYHKRATVHFLRSDEDASMRDLRATLAREPRHYSALAGLAAILSSLGQKKAAFSVLERTLAIHPQFEDVKKTYESLRGEVAGQPL